MSMDVKVLTLGKTGTSPRMRVMRKLHYCARVLRASQKLAFFMKGRFNENSHVHDYEKFRRLHREHAGINQGKIQQPRCRRFILHGRNSEDNQKLVQEKQSKMQRIHKRMERRLFRTEEHMPE